MEDILGPIDEIVLKSPKAEFQMRLRLGDDGSLYATLLRRLGDGRYEQPQGVGPARLARVSTGPRGEITGLFST
jgi:hypothetical protein